MARAARKKAVRAPEVLGPTPERMAKGKFQVVPVELEGHQDKRSEAFKDIASTTIDEWLSRGVIDERQHKACEYYLRLYHRAKLLQRVTANYDARICGGSGNYETQQEAIEDLRMWAGRIPPLPLSVFTNVVVFGHRTGTAGEALGYTSKKAEVAAITCVRLVADTICMYKRW